MPFNPKMQFPINFSIFFFFSLSRLPGLFISVPSPPQEYCALYGFKMHILERLETRTYHCVSSVCSPYNKTSLFTTSSLLHPLLHKNNKLFSLAITFRCPLVPLSLLCHLFLHDVNGLAFLKTLLHVEQWEDVNLVFFPLSLTPL